MVSSNVVGYKKVTLQPGLNLIGTGFTQIGGTDWQLKDLFQGTDVSNATAGEAADSGDLIQVFDPSVQGYANQYYFYYAGDGEEYDYKWYKRGDDDEPTEATINGINGFWYNFRGSQSMTLTTAGEVSTNDVVVTIQPGLNLITYPFPADFDFTSLDWLAAGATTGEAADSGDLIQVFNPSVQGYANQYYFYYGGDGEEYDNKWYKRGADDDPTSDVIPAGSGFWYNHRGSNSFTITLPSPL